MDAIPLPVEVCAMGRIVQQICWDRSRELEHRQNQLIGRFSWPWGPSSAVEKSARRPQADLNRRKQLAGGVCLRLSAVTPAHGRRCCGGGGSARSSSARPARRPSICAAIETGGHTRRRRGLAGRLARSSSRLLQIGTLLGQDRPFHRTHLQADAAVNAGVEVDPVEARALAVGPLPRVDAGHRAGIDAISDAFADVGDDRVGHAGLMTT